MSDDVPHIAAAAPENEAPALVSDDLRRLCFVPPRPGVPPAELLSAAPVADEV